MSVGELNLKTLLQTMKPKLHPELFVFISFQDKTIIPSVIENSAVFTMREEEGRTFVVPKNVAESHKCDFEYPCRMITLQVHSSLAAIGEFFLSLSVKIQKLYIKVFN